MNKITESVQKIVFERLHGIELHSEALEIAKSKSKNIISFARKHAICTTKMALLLSSNHFKGFINLQNLPDTMVVSTSTPKDT